MRWLRVQELNLRQQGQSLLCLRYTNPQCLPSFRLPTVCSDLPRKEVRKMKKFFAILKYHITMSQIRHFEKFF